MSDCTFCSIVASDLPSRTVYEDEATVAFLDANPLAPGHTLVVPKTHHQHVEDMDASTADALFSTLHALVGAVQEAVDAPASNVGINNGPAAGQEVPHVHAHIVPRFEGDGGRPIHAVAGSRPSLSAEALDDIRDDIETRV